MKRQDFYNEERALYDAENAEQNAQIRQLLEPKHAPHCDIKFRHQKRERTMMLRGFFNFTSIAAALVIGLFIGVGINHITAHENERIIAQAIKKHEAVESFYSEGVTAIKTYTTGAKYSPNYQPLNNEVKYISKLVRKNGIVYSRTEYQDENSTVEICDGKTLSTWANGKQISEISVGNVNVPMLDMINSEDVVSFIKEELGVSAAIVERGDRLVVSYKSKNSSDRYVAYHFSKKDKTLISSIIYKIVDGKIGLLQSIDKIICNEPLSIEEIIAPPTK